MASRKPRSEALPAGLCVVLLLGWSIYRTWSEAKPPSKPWEPQILAFEARDKTNAPPKGAILLVGSSSIRLWNTARQDLGPLPIVRRGFGGSQMSDLIAYADRIILPYEPRLVIVYAGDNDIASHKPPRRVLADFRQLVGTIQARLPNTRVGFVSIKPSSLRWHLVRPIRRANALVKSYCESSEGVDYLDIFTPMLDPDGNLRMELLAPDGLHLSEAGYRVWTSVLKSHLTELEVAAAQ